MSDDIILPPEARLDPRRGPRGGQVIEPPTGDALREVLLGMHTIPDEGIDAQILRW